MFSSKVDSETTIWKGKLTAIQQEQPAKPKTKAKVTKVV
jgi:hypothetical protein